MRNISQKYLALTFACLLTAATSAAFAGGPPQSPAECAAIGGVRKYLLLNTLFKPFDSQCSSAWHQDNLTNFSWAFYWDNSRQACYLSSQGRINGTSYNCGGSVAQRCYITKVEGDTAIGCEIDNPYK